MKDLREQFHDETGRYYYDSSKMDFFWSDEYVEWLEAKIGDSNE